MRITFVLPGLTYVGGGFRTVMVLSKGLQARGHDVQLVAASPPRLGKKGRIMDALRLPDRKARRSRRIFRDEGLEVTTADMPVRAEQFPDADILVVTWFWAVNWVAPLPPEKGLQVHYVQGNDVTVAGDKFGEDARAAFSRQTPRIAVSDWLRDFCTFNFPQGNKPLVVPNGVDDDFLRTSPRRPPTEPTVGCLWSKNTVKAPELILDVMRGIRERMPHVRTVMFGQRSRESLPDFLDYTENPSRQQIQQIYSSCTAWLWPSREEGFGLPLLESMATGTPVVATATGVAPEVVPSGGGIVVPVDDRDALVAGLGEICSLPPEEWQKRSDAARAEAAKHPWSATVDGFEKALLSFLEQSRAS